MICNTYHYCHLTHSIPYSFRWQQRVYLDPNTLICNCNDVVMTHGRGFINEKHTCELCGSKDGMKIQCAEPCCRGWGELRKPPSFHATCARQAGLEVENRPREDGYGYDFYVKCFRHGSNMFNLRARLEDLIEIEKRRSGKVLESKDTKTMSFVHASRLLNASILVLHTLGWAWRWAEWWVLYRDSWEPLLEAVHVLKRVVELRIGHRARLEPTVEHLVNAL